MWKRLFTSRLPRLLALSTLIGLGWLLWQLLPPQPRCHIPGPGLNSHLSHDGRLLVVDYPVWDSQNGDTTLKVWDTYLGQIRWENFHPWAVTSADARFFVRRMENQLLAFDLVSGREYPFQVEKTPSWVFIHAGRDMFVSRTEKAHYVGEFATGRILKSYYALHDVELEEVVLSADEIYCLYQKHEPNFEAKMAVVEDLRTGQRVLELEDVERCWFSPASSYLVHWGDGGLELWDLKGGQNIQLPGHLPVWRNQVERPNYYPLRERLLSPDDRFVLLEKDRTFVLFELPGGQKRSSFQIPEKEGGIYTLCFSPNGLLLALLSGNSSVMVFEVATGKKLWERLDNNPLPGNLAFCDNSQTLVVGKGIPNYSGEFLAKKEIAWAFLSWEFFEANSGNLLLEPYFRGYGGHPILDILPTELVVVAKPVSESRYFHWLRNWLGIPAKDWSLAVFDPATGQSQGQLYCDEQHSFCARSGDGRTLVTEADGGYDVWDLPLRPALHWVLGPPWALAALWLLWEWRWRSRRRKIKPA